MKAAVFKGVEDIQVEDVPQPKAGAEDIVVKVHVCGICGSDLHSYLHGAGVEFQASSDNVLRAGLTSKKIDLPELLAVIVGDHGRQPIVHPTHLAPGLDAYQVPVDDFAVWRVSAGAEPVQVPAQGPVIAVCVAGTVSFAGTRLTPGSAAYLPGGGHLVDVAGPGVCFVTAAGSQPP